MIDSPHTNADPRYSIVVPCFNEQDCIGPLFDEIVGVIGNDPDFELIIVDDGSSDQTVARLVAARDTTSVALTLVVHGENSGQSAAMCTGIDVARGKWIATLDGDGQNDPRDIPKLIAELDKYLVAHPMLDAAPIICGFRKRRNDSRVKRWSSKIANAVRSRLLRDATPDTGCGLKLMSRESFMRLPRFDHMHRFLPALMQREGATAISIEVGHRPRAAGYSKYGINNRLWVGIVDLIGVLWLRRRRLRLTNWKEV
ncbi:MAG: glycosyltransferase family 2 protein [Proteobacteria bacterium]|nr:glycosyltransferase family 2 protein [Pseudomonadota bacterium]